jgi:hypothetical protein
MMLQYSSQSNVAPPPGDLLLAVVLRYQQTYRDWAVEKDIERRAGLHEALRKCHEELWPLLADPLLQVARGWLRSNMARDMLANPTSYPSVEDVLVSLAQNLYLHVVDDLPRLQVDPNKNLLACLKTIARRGMFDENQRVYNDTPRHLNEQVADQSIASGTHSAQMWSESKRSDVRIQGNMRELDLVDPDSIEFEDRLIKVLDQQACYQKIQSFWQTLPDVDQQIVQLRWKENPPVPFETIAQRFGPGWTAATVRQRHCRIKERTRIYLQEHGFINNEEPSEILSER